MEATSGWGSHENLQWRQNPLIDLNKKDHDPLHGLGVGLMGRKLLGRERVVLLGVLD
jgi:hypothetical protein